MLISLLFMQLAVAAHACEGLAPVPMAAVATMADHEMAGCMGQADASPGLCDEHCSPPSQSLDRTAAPDVAAFFPVLLVHRMAEAASAVLPAPHRSGHSPLARRGAPSLAVRHCCFRI
ncbi:hypothetical protein [Janthinobacterium fluminis]|uniref:hypothetical protein n=1 Tax=Janthinobacterium fluminis TaxID=2987524 RepID=UPI002359A296|nr:hypothetical protein [Janthinobacterium fluminis]